MMKKLLLAVGLLALACPVFSQELYVNTEPASNMATNSLGIRVEDQGYFKPGYKNRAMKQEGRGRIQFVGEYMRGRIQ